MTSSANRRLLSRVDKVFNRIASESSSRVERPKKRRRVDSDNEPAGGFVYDDTSGGFIQEDSPGGFIPDDTQLESNVLETRGEKDTIPLIKVPDALQLLDLPPDDSEVLSVFRNAASGWSNQAGGTPGDASGGGVVTRADFRSICLVLLGGEDSEDVMDVEVETKVFPAPTEESDASDVYQRSSLSSLSSLSEPEDEDDESYEYEEYKPAPKSKSQSKRKKGRHDSDSDTEFSASKRLTPRQKKVCLDAFQLFFPTIGPADLPNQRIYLKDIIRVAESLKENIKSDDMLDMLTEFSDSTDKSVNLQDFEKIMIASKLA